MVLPARRDYGDADAGGASGRRLGERGGSVARDRPDGAVSILRRRVVSLFCAPAQPAGRHRGDNFCAAPCHRQRHRGVLRGLMVGPHQVGSAGESEKDRGGGNRRAGAMRCSRIAAAPITGTGMELRPSRSAFGGNRNTGTIGRPCRLGAQAQRLGEGFGMDFPRPRRLDRSDMQHGFRHGFRLLLESMKMGRQPNLPSNNRKL